MSNVKRITIIGAGLVGSMLSLFLAKLGYEVEIYEKRSDSRLFNTYEGKSINLALSHRGIRALEELGIFEDVKDMIIPMVGRQMHDIAGDLTFLPYGKDDSEVINSISRGQLNMKMIDLAEESGKVKIHFDHLAVNYEYGVNELIIRYQNEDKILKPSNS